MRWSWAFVLFALGCGCTRTVDPPRVARPGRSLQSVIEGAAELGHPRGDTRPFLRDGRVQDASVSPWVRALSRTAVSLTGAFERADDAGALPETPGPLDEEPGCFAPLAACRDSKQINWDSNVTPPGLGYSTLAAALASLACGFSESECQSDPTRCAGRVRECVPVIRTNREYACGVATFGTTIVLNEPWLEGEIASEPLSATDAQWLVLGVFAHEEGHVLYHKNRAEASSRSGALARTLGADGLTPLQGEELFADATAGCVLARAPEVGVTLLMKFIQGVQRVSGTPGCTSRSDQNHPCVCLRSRAIREGWRECARGRPMPPSLEAALPGCT
jgi:hypothetical protein